MNNITLAPILSFVLEERSWPNSARLNEMAELLPPVACAGIEFPLHESGVVHLQQRIRTIQQVKHLKRLVQSRTSHNDFQWQTVLDFCNQELVTGCVEDLWLELDDDDSSVTPPVSLFVRLPARLLPAEYVCTVNWVLKRFGCDPGQVRQQTLEQCLNACPPDARLSYLGLMLGRDGAPVRLVFDKIPFNSFSSFLQCAGWKGSFSEVQKSLDELFTYVDRIRLALTIGEELHTSLGFECFMGEPWKKEPRWGAVFDLLVLKGLCSQEQRSSVLSWPGRITPASAGSAWPYSLILDALGRNPEEIGWLDCRISHVKITYNEKQLAEAKAYLGFIEIWEDLGKETGSPSVTVNSGRCCTNVEEGIGAAVEFLLHARTQAGWWLDYDGFQEGVSDEWVTAYVAFALAETGGLDAEAAALRAWRLLEQRSRDGWGWNYLQPADADSTIWALRLSSVLGMQDSEKGRRALEFVRRHLQPDGSVVTYLAGCHSTPASKIRINPSWYAPHLCVTAVAANLASLGDTSRHYLLGSQQSDGSWQGYWWKDAAYTTAHAVEALSLHGTAEARHRLADAAGWAGRQLNTFNPAESPFVAALSLQILLAAPEPDLCRIRETAKRLLACQQKDGSWQSSAQLMFPNCQGQEILAEDHRRTFTTATVLRSLSRLRTL